MSDLADFLAEGWSELSRGAAQSDHPMRTVAMATLAERGPAVRYVVLRDVNAAQSWVEVHTDVESAKVAELTSDPRCSIVAWSPASRLQIRLAGQVSVRTGEEVRDLWDDVPPGARVAYGSVPPPGRALAAADGYDISPAVERFAVLRLAVAQIDMLHLGERHRRARFETRDEFEGQWLAP